MGGLGALYGPEWGNSGKTDWRSREEEEAVGGGKRLRGEEDRQSASGHVADDRCADLRVVPTKATGVLRVNKTGVQD